MEPEGPNQERRNVASGIPPAGAGESEGLLRSMVQHSSDVMALLERDGSIRYASPAVERVLGYRPEEVVGTSVFHYVHPDDVQGVSTAFAESLQSPGLLPPLEFRARAANGSWPYVEVLRNNRLDDPDVQGILISVRDISQRKEAEEHLRRTEERYRTLVERVPAVTYVQQASAPSPVTFVSPQMEHLLGYSPAECTSDPDLWLHILHPDDREGVLAEAERTDRTGDPFEMEYRQIAKDGRVVWVRDEATLVRGEGGEPLYWLGVLTDTTDRKRTEEALKEIEERYRLAARASNEVIWDLNIENMNLNWAGDISNMFGYSEEQIGGNREWEERLHPDDRQGVLASFEVVLGGGKESWSAEYRFRQADGTYAVIADRAYVMRDETGEPKRLIGSMMDVTESREAEKRLYEAEKRFRTLVEQMPAVTYIEAIDDGEAETVLLYVSPQIEEQFGYTPEEWIHNSETWADLLYPEDRRRVMDEDARTEGTGEPYLVEYRIHTRDGRLVWLRDEAVLVRDDDGAPLYWQGVLIDITERKRVEQAVEEAREAAEEAREAAEEASRAKSRFVANMSHEIRTPMSGVIGMTELLLETPLSDDQREFAETIRRSGQTLLSIINDILDFSRIEAGGL